LPGEAIMLTVSQDTKIYVYTEHIDMRRSIDGLVIMLADTYQLNPQTGDLFIFTNKSKNKIKLLFWDKNGFVLYYKKLERGKFNYSRYIQDETIMITSQQLRALLMGLDFYLMGQYSHEICHDFF
jgi:transposase